MSEIAQTPATGAARPTPRSEPAAREAYAFACMRCGHGWEQAYEIQHQVDAGGQTHVVYYADGERVPSPLTRPTCLNCGGNVVRIMRAGQVSMVSNAIASMHQRQHGTKNGGRRGSAAAGDTAAGSTAAEGERHHWHLSDLLHPFHHHRG
ncbi:hypothetical protein ACWIG3_18265 [Streptomyces celluloflavus]|nr:hypothetical protein [Streptomyces kasugaensis]WSK12926.1 hypothetical protein OG717_14800 [Streptomyces celluloflavus]